MTKPKEYAALLLGLALVLASVVAAAAGDHAFFICPPGKTEVSIFYIDDSEEAKKNAGYYIKDKRFPFTSRLFRLDQTGKKGDILFYRGKRCVEEPELSVAEAQMPLRNAGAQTASKPRWEADCRRGYITKTFPKDDFTKDDFSLQLIETEDGITIRITEDEFRDLENGIRDIRKSAKFFQCLADRDAGKVKHCYENDRRWRGACE